MKRTGFLTVFALLFLCFSLMAKPYYVIEMVKLKENAAGMPEEYLKGTALNASKFNGSFVTEPVHVLSQIETAVKPEYTTAFDYDRVFILKFKDRRKARAYLKDSSVSKLRTEYQSRFLKHTAFIGKTMRALPGMEDFPLISTAALRPEPAFLLINAIDMKMYPGPVMRMMKYFKRNYPLLKENGTGFFATFKVSKVVYGDFPFGMLFLTEWESMENFQKVHDHPSFRKNVHLRNSSFSGFTEALGRVKK